MPKNYLGQERSKDDLRRLPEETANLITTYAAMPKYQHGTGCNCYKNKLQKNKCPKGEAIYTKIGKELGISPSIVHCYLDEEYRDFLNNQILQYTQSEEGKTTITEYEQSEKGRATRKRAMKKYHQSEKGIDTKKEYKQSDKGKIKRMTWNFIEDSSLMYKKLNLNKLEERKGYWIDYFNEVFAAGIEA